MHGNPLFSLTFLDLARNLVLHSFSTSPARKSLKEDGTDFKRDK